MKTAVLDAARRMKHLQDKLQQAQRLVNAKDASLGVQSLLASVTQAVAEAENKKKSAEEGAAALDEGVDSLSSEAAESQLRDVTTFAEAALQAATKAKASLDEANEASKSGEAVDKETM